MSCRCGELRKYLEWCVDNLQIHYWPNSDIPARPMDQEKIGEIRAFLKFTSSEIAEKK